MRLEHLHRGAGVAADVVDLELLALEQRAAQIDDAVFVVRPAPSARARPATLHVGAQPVGNDHVRGFEAAAAQQALDLDPAHRAHLVVVLGAGRQHRDRGHRRGEPPEHRHAPRPTHRSCGACAPALRRSAASDRRAARRRRTHRMASRMPISTASRASTGNQEREDRDRHRARQLAGRDHRVGETAGGRGRGGAHQHGRALHRAGEPTARDHRQRPAPQRVHVGDDARGDHDAGDDRRRRRDGVEQMVEPGDVVGGDLDRRRDAQHHQGRRAADPVELRREGEVTGGLRQRPRRATERRSETRRRR